MASSYVALTLANGAKLFADFFTGRWFSYAHGRASNRGIVPVPTLLFFKHPPPLLLTGTQRMPNPRMYDDENMASALSKGEENDCFQWKRPRSTDHIDRHREVQVIHDTKPTSLYRQSAIKHARPFISDLTVDFFVLYTCSLRLYTVDICFRERRFHVVMVHSMHVVGDVDEKLSPPRRHSPKSNKLNGSD